MNTATYVAKVGKCCIYWEYRTRLVMGVGIEFQDIRQLMKLFGVPLYQVGHLVGVCHGDGK